MGDPAPRPGSTPGRNRRLTDVAAAAAVALPTALAGAAVGAATVLSRRLLTPDYRMVDDVTVVSVSDDEIVLGRTPVTVLPGTYGLWVDGGAGHCRVGAIRSIHPGRGTVTRALLGVDVGRLSPGPARWDPYVFAGTPQSALGLPTEHVEIAGEPGVLPAWVVPGAADARGTGTWAVLVHGRGARREEALRALPTLHALGLTSLVTTYRNDQEAPPGPDGRYYLGLAEWRDVESAVRFALARGAERIVLVGWSMGGAIVLQLLDRSPLAEHVAAVVLDGPVVDWAEVLRFHLGQYHAPWPVLAAATRILRHPRQGRWLIGLHEPVDLSRTDWVTRSAELRHPMLIVHSHDDDVVPGATSMRLAALRPDLVTFVDDGVARHCQEWNVDPQRWEGVVRDFLTTTLSLGTPSAS